MTIRSRLAKRWSEAFGVRTSGYPTSANAASSFHLRWLGLPPDERLVEVSVTLEIVEPPAVQELYFWALQASFVDGTRTCGAGHLGLQWYPAHPGGTAANWGGYSAGCGELSGTGSDLASSTGNPNTRDFGWVPFRPYRLSIAAGSDPGSWRGSIDGRVIRELHCPAASLADVMVWSEVFARCSDPSVVVRWSDFSARTSAGVMRPDRLAVSYQSSADGGCDNTTVRVVAGIAEQHTNVRRDVAPGATLSL